MYRITQRQPGDEWVITDESDQIAFIGTLQQCEDWLDFREHVRAAAPSTPYRFWRWLRALSGLSTAKGSNPSDSNGDDAPAPGA